MTEQIDFWIVRKGDNLDEVASEAVDAITQFPRENVCLFCGFDHKTGAIVAFRWREDPDAYIYAAEFCVDCAKHSNEKLAELAEQELPKLAQAKREVEEMLERVRRAQSNS
jgi:hypothetical protein